MITLNNNNLILCICHHLLIFPCDAFRSSGMADGSSECRDSEERGRGRERGRDRRERERKHPQQDAGKQTETKLTSSHARRVRSAFFKRLRNLHRRELSQGGRTELSIGMRNLQGLTTLSSPILLFLFVTFIFHFKL